MVQVFCARCLQNLWFVELVPSLHKLINLYTEICLFIWKLISAATHFEERYFQKKILDSSRSCKDFKLGIGNQISLCIHTSCFFPRGIHNKHRKAYFYSKLQPDLSTCKRAKVPFSRMKYTPQWWAHVQGPFAVCKHERLQMWVCAFLRLVFAGIYEQSGFIGLTRIAF